MHTSEWLKLQYPSELNWLGFFPGVAIFFVTSGFLVAGSYIQNDRNLWSYFRNRALRIYPALWVNFFVIVLMLVIAGVLTWESLTGRWFATYLLTMIPTASTLLTAHTVPLQGFHWNEAVPFFPGGALWTIPVELSFYLVLPAVLMFKRPVFSVVCVALISLAFAMWYGAKVGPLWTATCAPYLWIFLLGTLARLAWPIIEVAFNGTFLVWAAILIAYCHTFNTVPDYQSPTPVNVLALILLAAATLSFAYTLPKLSSVLKRVDISYGTYLYHMPIIMIFMWCGFVGETWMWPAVFVATAVVATLSWVFVEKPALTLKKRGSREDARSLPVDRVRPASINSGVAPRS